MADITSQEQRPNNRPTGASRDITIGLGLITTADSSALIKIGSSTALASVRCEITPTPTTDTPIAVNVEMPPLCSAEIRPGRAPEQATILTEQLTTLFNMPHILDTQQLNITTTNNNIAGSWLLFIDVYILDADGCLLDTAVLATVSALSQVTLPSVEWDPQDGVVKLSSKHQDTPQEGRHLILSDVPIALTCGTQQNGEILVDPQAVEEYGLDGTVQIVTGNAGAVLYMNIKRAGGLNEVQLKFCVEAAKRRREKALKILNEARGQ